NRITAHREERGGHWSTVEAPLLLTSALREHAGQGRVCVVDCLTIWLSNLMHHEKDPDEATNALCSTLADLNTPVILVSNEVGLGIVPESPLGRRFRDAQGRLNQRMAACCEHVEFMVAGLPMTLKGESRV
ncbi:MAG: bifunctional adenosylcobinamide kinase/adenosylcobinamide-phosphate guanylyltransferase, partial [Pseudomonadota bacterium]